MPDHDRYEASVAAWALGSLDDAGEAERLAAHVAGCAGCRALEGRVRRAVGALPLAADEVRPPAGLRGRILSEASRTPQLAPVVSLPRQRPAFGARRWGWAQVAVAAMAVALAGLGTWNLSLLSQVRSPAAVCSIKGSGSMVGVSGCVQAVPAQHLTLVSFKGLPDAPAGKVYELWLVPAAGAPQPAAVFVPVGGAQTVVVQRSLEGVHAVALTLESGPAGAASPTSKPEVAGTL